MERFMEESYVLKVSNKNTTLDTPFATSDGSSKLKDYNTLDIMTKKNTVFMSKNNIPQELINIYKKIGSDHEIKSGRYTIMCLDELISKDFYKNFIYIGHTYYGMGHIKCIGLDKNTGKLFIRMDGGSNGYDREYNHKSNLQYDPNLDNETGKYTFEQICQDIIFE